MSDELPLLFCVASHDGQARRIAERMTLRLAERGFGFHLHDLYDGPPAPAVLDQAAMVVVVAAIRYGFHLPCARRFVKTHAAELSKRPFALVSVCLTARKPGKDTPEGNVYLRKWLRRMKAKPQLAAAIAGKLDYPRYAWWERQIIRLIMKMTGGPTDPSTVMEYTNWQAVDAFGDQIAAKLTKDVQPAA